jgi:cytoskeletal protein RodZ
MLTLNKTKSSKKKIILVVLAAVVVIAAAIWAATALYQDHVRKSQQTQTPFTEPINYEEPTAEQKQEGEEAKIERIEKSEQEQAQGTGTVTISSITQASAGKDVVAQVQISATDGANCTLTLTRQGVTVTKTAPVLFQPTSSTCAGFAVPASEFAASGTWSATVAVSKTNGTTITSQPAQVTITK